MRLPPEILDQIVLDVEDPRYGDDRYIVRPKQIHDDESKWRLSTLRLVDKAFCRSASIRFFRNVRVTLSSHHSRFASCHWPPKRLFDLSRSEWCCEVRELVVDISRGGEHSDLEYFLVDMVAILLACLTNFRRLASVGIRGPLVDSADMPDGMRLAVRALAADLLRYVPLLELKELVLALPLTFDFSAIMRRALTSDDTPLRIPLHIAMANIKHLDLTVYDSTDGDAPSVRPPPSTFHSNTPRLVQVRHPNHAYAAQFFKFAQLPTRLESLRISCSHTLDMDHFNIHNLVQLHRLDLNRIKISSTRLIAIVQNCATALRGIILEAAELKSGTWRDIFLALCKLDNLHVFHVMDGCTYASDGISAQWALRERRRHRTAKSGRAGEIVELLTKFWSDEPALGNLQRRVLANRAAAGLQTIDEGTYRYVSWVPLTVG